jgi:hypothetical protein
MFPLLIVIKILKIVVRFALTLPGPTGMILGDCHVSPARNAKALPFAAKKSHRQIRHIGVQSVEGHSYKIPRDHHPYF